MKRAQTIKNELLKKENNVNALVASAEISKLQANITEAIYILEKGYEQFEKLDDREIIALNLALLNYFSWKPICCYKLV